MKKSKIIEYIVEKDMCTGCGTCVAVTKNDFLKMELNEFGFMTPKQSHDNYTDLEDSLSLNVCPFNPYPNKEVKTEDEIADIFLEDNLISDKQIGKYNGLYVGYSKEFRKTSSSGGIATYLFNNLLKSNTVQHIVCVQESGLESEFYEYNIISNYEDILKSSKTKYFPVTMAQALEKIEELEGKVAIVGVACFIKSIRLLQHQDKKYKEKISFLVGIICGGIKSSFFAEYLASKSGVERNKYYKPNFRIKDENSAALDYSFGCLNKDNDKLHTVKMRSVGDMWGTGLFKTNACDFCEDVATELADISLGDAWIHPYSSDGRGNSIIISRSELGLNILKDGIKSGDLNLDEVGVEKIKASQSSSFKHRQDALKYRMKITSKENRLHSPKRERNLKSINLPYKIVQKQRRETRKKSLVYWKQSNDIIEFEKLIKKSLEKLKSVTKMYHYSNAIKNKLKFYDSKKK